MYYLIEVKESEVEVFSFVMYNYIWYTKPVVSYSISQYTALQTAFVSPRKNIKGKLANTCMGVVAVTHTEPEIWPEKRS
jgi:hypothetical protein